MEHLDKINALLSQNARIQAEIRQHMGNALEESYQSLVKIADQHPDGIHGIMEHLQKMVVKSHGPNARLRKPVAPKYRNPHDASQTWTGRGRKPKWVTSYLTIHSNLDDVTI